VWPQLKAWLLPHAITARAVSGWAPAVDGQQFMLGGGTRPVLGLQQHLPTNKIHAGRA
jgi:hypothetical protein